MKLGHSQEADEGISMETHLGNVDPGLGGQRLERVAIVYFDEIGGRVSAVSGFGPRYRLLVEDLRSTFSTRLFRLAIDGTTHDEALRPGDIVIRPSAFPGSRSTRALRVLSCLTPSARVWQWERELYRHLRAFSPDIVIVFCWTFRGLFRSLPKAFPVICFVEESLTGSDFDADTRHGRAFRAIEHLAWDRTFKGAQTAVVISPAEVWWAHNRFNPGSIAVVPHAIDIDFWSSPVPAAEPTERPYVFVAGHAGHRRNAEGLRAVAGALGQSAPQIRLASSSSLHPCLKDLPEETLVSLGEVADLRPFYRRAVGALIPAFAVSGVKTTILQAWAANCPVVTTEAAASTVGGDNGIHLLSGKTPVEVAQQVDKLLEDQALRARLVENGFALVKDRFDPQRASAALMALLSSRKVLEH